MEKDYAGFWIRFLAYMLDGLIFLGVGAVIMAVTGIPMKYLLEFMQFELKGAEMQQALYGFLLLVYALALPATSLQGTLGKAMLGLKIVDKDGGRISLLRSLGRVLSQIVSTLILYIGYIMIGFHPQKRGLHDIMAGTYVVKK